MKKWLAISVLCVGINACSKNEAPAPAATAPATAPAPQAEIAALQAPPADIMTHNLAFDRLIRAKTGTDQMRAVYEKLLELCQADAADACQQMTSALETSPNAHADIKFRVNGGGVPGLRAILDKNGEIIGETTTVEDAAEPAADNARHIAQLKAYLENVQAMHDRPGNDLDTLMRLARELADTQTSIDQLSGDGARIADHSRQQNLEIIITPTEQDEKWAPIGHSLRNSLTAMGSSFAALVALLAYVIPWMLLAVPVYYAVRRFGRK